MTAATQAAYDKAQRAIDDAGNGLARDDYRDFIEELRGHLSCVIDCLDEEDKANE